MYPSSSCNYTHFHGQVKVLFDFIMGLNSLVFNCIWDLDLDWVARWLVNLAEVNLASAS